MQARQHRYEGKRTVVGVVSDTHGPLPRQVSVILAGADHVICAGDIVSPEVMGDLRLIAPQVTAVHGNMDREGPLRALPAQAVVELGGVVLLVLHDLAKLDLDPRAAGFAAVIHGHTHKALVEWDDGVLYMNPGSAGDPRSGRPATVGRIVIVDRILHPEIVELR